VVRQQSITNTVGPLAQRPTTCEPGSQYTVLDAVPGTNLHICYALNKWKAIAYVAGDTGALRINCDADPCTADIAPNVIPSLNNQPNQWLNANDFSKAILTAPVRVEDEDPAECNSQLPEMYFNRIAKLMMVCTEPNKWTVLNATPAAQDKPPIKKAQVSDVDYAGAQILIQTEGIPADAKLAVAYSPNPAELADGAITAQTPVRGSNGREDWYDQSINNAPANSKVYIRPFMSGGGAVNSYWKCANGAISQGELVGLTCEPGIDWPYFLTTAIPGPPDTSYPNGTYPAVAMGATYIYPSFGTLTEGVNLFTVSKDCSDVNEKLAAAAKATQDFQVLLPVNVDCQSIELPLKPGGVTGVIRSSASDLSLPAPGTRPQPRHQPHMARVVGRLTAVNTHGWRFFGIEFITREIIPTGDTPSFTIVRSERNSGSANIWRLTLDRPHGLLDSDKVMLSAVARLNNTCKPGAAAIYTIPSQTVVTVDCAGAVVPSTPDTSSGRAIAGSMVQRIQNAVPGSASCEGGVLISLATGMVSGLDKDTVIVINGSEGLTINGNWRVTPVTPGSFCLQNSTHITGLYVANSAYYVVDTNVRTLVSLEQNTSDIWIDRCIIRGRGFPTRVLTGVLLLGSQSGVLNSRFENIEGWQSVDPVTKDKKIYTTSYFLTTPIAVDFSYGKNQTIQNNSITGHGILLFAQQGDGKATNHVENVLIRGNTIYSPFKYMAGHKDNVLGLYYSHRHALELKRGKQITIEDNQFTGGWADNLTAGWAAVMTIRGAVEPGPAPEEQNTIRDIIFRRNFMRDVAAGINITNYNDGGPLANQTKRIAIEDNVISGIDWFSYRSQPSAQAGPNKVSSATGGGGMSLGVGNSLTVRNNLIYYPIGSGPRNLLVFRGSHTRILNNVSSHNEFNGGGIYASPGTDGIPAVSSGTLNATRWNNLTQVSGTPDPYSAFKGNVLTPGTQNNYNYNSLDPTCWESTSGNCNVTQAEMDSKYGTSSGTFESPAKIATWNGTTPSARISEVLWAKPDRGDFRIQRAAAISPISSASRKATDGYGVGPRANLIESYSLNSRNARAIDITPNSATIAYESRGKCYLEFDNKRLEGPSGSSPARRIDLTGLNPKTTYKWILSCPSEEFEGSFQTN